MAKKTECPIRTNRIFILDTNVLLHDPNSIYSFQAVVVGIPFVVLEELDELKRAPGEKGRNARALIRSLDELRSRGNLLDGVELNHNTNGAIFRVFPNPMKVEFSDKIHSIKDNLILESVRQLSEQGCHVTLVTKDINLRVKADVLKLDVEDYTKGKINSDEIYKGWIKIPVPSKDLKLLSASKIFPLVPKDHELFPNQFIILESENNPENNKVFRFLGGKECISVEPITIMNTFQAKNTEQLMALDLLMDDKIKFITLLGSAGTGKTFLTILAGLYKVALTKTYRKLLITRPVVALGADIGFLPGDMQEKLHYWMQPVHDNLEFISSQLMRGNQFGLNQEPKPHNGNNSNHHSNHNNKHKKNKHPNKDHHQQRSGNGHPSENYMVDNLQARGILSLEAITYMRGRSIPEQFLFIDEVQNLTPHEVKTLVSRAGEGTKVILAGDPYQIDSPYLDFSSNGLTVTADKMKNYPICGSIFLEKSERSELAKLAGEVL